MPSKTAFILAAALGLATSAVADADRPRIYYPTRAVEDVDGEVDLDTDDNEEMKRGLFDDILEDFKKMDQGDGNNGGLLSNIFDPNNRQKNDDPPVTTIIVDKTVEVPPGGTGVPAAVPNPEPQPTTSSTRRPRPRPSTTRSGILIGPSGIIRPSPTSVSSETSSPEPESSSSASTEPESSAESGTSVSETSTEVVNSTIPQTSSVQATESVQTTEANTGLIPILTSIVSSILPAPTESVNATTTDVTQTTDVNQTTTTTDGILPTSIIPIITGTETTTTTGTETTTTATETSGIPTDSTTFPTLTVTEVPGGNATSTGGETTIQTPTLTPTDSVNSTETLTTSTLTPTSTPIGIITSTQSSNGTETATTAIETSTPIQTSTPIETSTIESTPLPTSTPTGVTSITPTATGSGSSDWLPSTMIVEPTTLSFTAPTTTETGTTATSLPTNIPKVIVPSDGDKPPPKDTTLIQIGFKYPLNYDFVSGNSVAAAQIFQMLPIALAEANGLKVDKVQISKLVPMDTRNSDGFITTLAKLHYPSTMVDALKASLWIPNSKLYNNPSAIVNNLTALINPSIDLTGNNDDEGVKSTGSGSNNSNDAFGSGSNDQSSQSSKQRATTAGIVMGAVGLGAMYGAAMFIVARRYKRKRQNHRRSSSISSAGRSEDMQFAGNGSPALMGGALLSPNNRGTYGGQSQNSMNSSARTANISPPLATENSLGWN